MDPNKTRKYSDAEIAAMKQRMAVENLINWLDGKAAAGDLKPIQTFFLRSWQDFLYHIDKELPLMPSVKGVQYLQMCKQGLYLTIIRAQSYARGRSKR